MNLKKLLVGIQVKSRKVVDCATLNKVNCERMLPKEQNNETKSLRKST